MTIQELKDKGLLLLECVSGSRAYGLATAQSDTDIRGVYYWPKEKFYGLDYIDQVSNSTNDEVYYELGKFMALLLKNNPNILELLAAPDNCVLYRHPLMQQLSPDLFLSALCKETFGNYALTQIKKARGLNKKMMRPVEKERKGVLDFCYVMQGQDAIALPAWLIAQGWQQERCGLAAMSHAKGLYALYYDVDNTLKYRGIVSSELANEVCLSSIPKGEKIVAYLHCNIDGYSMYCKEYREYWEWMEKRNEDRYQSNQAHGGEYDAKNMMHTIRLLQVAEEIARTGTLVVKRPNREELLAIKSGAYSYEQLLQMAEDLQEKLVIAYRDTALQQTPDKDKIENILVAMRDKLYS
ncbi:Predicted nucleotidyltransferase [Filimonas lacunae]|uniref:Predicted nucleotidyltransferase n=1 Tax=Filimonas lacunae TaxID=477680 RepID=A0A173MRB0_9BACT|nr:nucleotidyltransferase domain-containing protein [Filimonas lacunae]BAV10027.1 hypothetical protein FLA_6081 [Filimonas lacunae]SIS82777.1 Predicted nucleotidyltransferase [Filimonas lacunae]